MWLVEVAPFQSILLPFQSTLLFVFIEEDGVDVAFQVVDGDEREVLGEGQGFGIGDADEECSGETWAAGDGYGVEVGEGDIGLGESGADDGDDGAEMLA